MAVTRGGPWFGVSDTEETPSRSSRRPPLSFKVDSHLKVFGRPDTKPVLADIALAGPMTTVTGFLPLLQDFKD